MDRRDFVESLVVALGGVKLATFERHTRLNRIGLELYAVRDAMRANPEKTLAAIRAMGYLDVELLWSFDNFGRTPQQVRATLDKEGLRAPSAHMAPEVLLEDWDRSLEKAKALGHEYLIVPSLPSDTAKSLDRWKYWADQFNTAGAAARTAGIWLAFHNEPDHMKPLGGVVPYDVFVERTDPSVVRHQLDVGNMALGGVDPMKYLEKYRARYWSFHVKDVVAGGAKDTELGKGAVNLKGLLAKIPEINRKPVYVEQEGPMDSMASARMNYEYLARLDF